MAGCIANELIEKEVTVKKMTFTTIIDDLGVERSSEYATGIVFSVIDRRWRSGKPLIVTTILPLKELKEETNSDKKRIYDLF